MLINIKPNRYINLKVLLVSCAAAMLLACGSARDDVAEVKKTEQPAAARTTMTKVHEPVSADVTRVEQEMESMPPSGLVEPGAVAMPASVSPVQVETSPEKPDVIPAAATAGVTRLVAPDLQRVFDVSALPKEPSHLFYNKGHTIGFALNGIQNLEPVLERGEKYTFKVDTGVQHDFYLSSSPVGWGASTFSDGVTGNFTYKGIVTFIPKQSAPDVVYYQCRNHKNMGGRLHIVNKGEKAKITSIDSALKVSTAPAASSSRGQLDDNQIQQKINFAKMFIIGSAAEKRIMSSQNTEAKEKFQQAKNQLAISQDALADNDYSAAMSAVDQAMKSMADASKLVPTEGQKEREKTRYGDLLESIKGFENSYERNYKRMVKKKGAENVTRLDLDAVHDKIARAGVMAKDADYTQANKLLLDVQQTITTELTNMLDSETVSYELVFDTPADEYEYELSRYKSFEELIPVAIEQKQPPQESIDLMNSMVDKAREIYGLSGPEAEKKNYTTAIQMLQGATGRLQNALRIVGVR